MILPGTGVHGGRPRDPGAERLVGEPRRRRGFRADHRAVGRNDGKALTRQRQLRHHVAHGALERQALVEFVPQDAGDGDRCGTEAIVDLGEAETTVQPEDRRAGAHEAHEGDEAGPDGQAGADSHVGSAFSE